MDFIIHIIHNLPRENKMTIEFKFERISKFFKENEMALVGFQKVQRELYLLWNLWPQGHRTSKET
jgi:hypothetical protein